MSYGNVVLMTLDTFLNKMFHLKFQANQQLRVFKIRSFSYYDDERKIATLMSYLNP